MSGAVALQREVKFPGGSALQAVYYSGTRVNATAGAASTAEAALPVGFPLLEIRLTDFVWLSFGNTGMGAAAADTNSMLVAGGEKIMPVPIDPITSQPYTLFRVLRTGSSDVAVQFEGVSTDTSR